MPDRDLVRTLGLPLRIAQLVLAIIILGLTGYVANWWNGEYYGLSPSQVNFLIFTSVWTMLATAYLTVVPMRFEGTIAHHKFAILGVEAVTMIFWFAGFIALAVFLSDRLCYGSVCSAAKAATVFAAFQWVLFAVTTAFATMHVLRTRDRHDARADPNIKVQEGV